jgi:hypothetical protein
VTIDEQSLPKARLLREFGISVPFSSVKKVQISYENRLQLVKASLEQLSSSSTEPYTRILPLICFSQLELLNERDMEKIFSSVSFSGTLLFFLLFS